MTGSDIFILFQWWFTFLLIGFSALPLTVFLFKSFFDKGYLFTKILGLVILSYVILLLGIIHLVPFSNVTTLCIFFTLSGSIWFLFRKQQTLAILKTYWKIFLIEEFLFLAALSFWTYIHGFAPDIHGLEKYMDFGFIHSILRTEYFPPKDMWFTPLPINYYYFGHLMTAVVTKLSGLSAQHTFNLMLATIFALCFTQSFSLAANLFHYAIDKTKLKKIKVFLAGILSALLVTVGGNLHILYAFFKAYPNESPVPLWQLPFQPFLFPNGYWYPNATRFIHNTIHEFPAYSWTVADLHGHVLDIPLVLLTIAVLFALFIKSQNPNFKSQINSNKQIFKQANLLRYKAWKLLRIWKVDLMYLLTIGFLLAVMYMTNAWDGGIYLLLTGIVLFTLFLQYRQPLIFFASLGIVILTFSLIVFPYNLFFQPFVSGIGILCAPDFLTKFGQIGPFLLEKDHCQHSPWWQLLTLYGFFLFFIASFSLFLIKRKKTFPTDIFVLLLIILGLLLILIPELIYVKDIYPAHYRANTMFKLVFQAFIMLSVASGYIVVRIISSVKKPFAICYLPFASILIFLVFLYPFQSVKSYYGNLTTYKGLDGQAYLAKTYPSDFEAIQWLNENVKGQPVILEAQGDSYSDYARVSANTGLPTVLGWTVHEWLWRGTYDIPSPRITDVQTLYESINMNDTQELLKKYHIEYIFIGALERQKYPALYEEKFKQVGKVIFQEEETTIYQITPQATQ